MLLLKLAKIWVYLKAYWYVPVLVIAIVASYLFYQRKLEIAIQMLEASKESYKRQIEAINKAHEEEMAKQKKVAEILKSTLEQLQVKFLEDQKKLNSEEKAKIKEYVELYHNNPDELKKLLQDKYGLKYVETNKNN